MLWCFGADGRVLRLSKLESMNFAPYTVLGCSVVDIEAPCVSIDCLAAKGVEF